MNKCECDVQDVNELWEIVDPMRMLTGLLEGEGRGPPEAR